MSKPWIFICKGKILTLPLTHIFEYIQQFAIIINFSTSSLSQAILAARSRIFYKLLYQQQASPQRKNPQPPPVRENKLRLFLKRSSEPLLNLQNESQKVNFCAIFSYRHTFFLFNPHARACLCQIYPLNLNHHRHIHLLLGIFFLKFISFIFFLYL